MKYKVGDYVKVRSDLEADKIYGRVRFNEKMNSFLGKIFRIDSIYEYIIYLDEIVQWSFSEEMIEDKIEGDNMNKKQLQEQIEKLEKDLADLKEIANKPEVKKSKLWPERIEGQKYFSVCACIGDNNVDFFFDGFDKYDDYNYYTGNYFLSEQDAINASINRNTEIELIKLIKKINEEPECPDNFPDLADGHQPKYYIGLNSADSKSCFCAFDYFFKRHRNVFYCYRNFLQDAFGQMGEEKLIKYFDSL